MEVATATFAQDIEAAAKGEPIEAIVIRSSQWHGYYGDERDVPADKVNVVLSWDEARPLLDHAYDDSFGGQDCPDIVAWTPTSVLYIHEYDGSTAVWSVPRNPTVLPVDDGY